MAVAFLRHAMHLSNISILPIPSPGIEFSDIYGGRSAYTASAEIPRHNLMLGRAMQYCGVGASGIAN